eukprot:357442-Chlamydomonas_euryale.AAC.8
MGVGRCSAAGDCRAAGQNLRWQTLNKCKEGCSNNPSPRFQHSSAHLCRRLPTPSTPSTLPAPPTTLQGSVTALDISARKLGALSAAAAAAGAGGVVATVAADLREFAAARAASGVPLFDKALLDAPCSGEEGDGVGEGGGNGEKGVALVRVGGQVWRGQQPFCQGRVIALSRKGCCSVKEGLLLCQGRVVALSR